ncbi:hypothetical protein GQ42DRAFT_134232 [Ramicandelaber brevisporus]|nr:hypothetical protein GQ42DRAFT_134232 [Ramicandelaber brevisporus]
MTTTRKGKDTRADSVPPTTSTFYPEKNTSLPKGISAAPPAVVPKPDAYAAFDHVRELLRSKMAAMKLQQVNEETFYTAGIVPSSSNLEPSVSLNGTNAAAISAPPPLPPLPLTGIASSSPAQMPISSSPLVAPLAAVSSGDEMAGISPSVGPTLFEESSKIAVVRRTQVFEKSEITEQERDIIQQRVQLQQRRFAEFERREFERKARKIRQMFDYITDEELKEILADCRNDEDDALVSLTQPTYLNGIRKTVAMKYSQTSTATQQAVTMTTDQQLQYEQLMVKRTRTLRKKTTEEAKRKYRYQGRLALDDALRQIQGKPPGEAGDNLEELMKGWSQARIRAYGQISKNPNSYYYRFNAPGEVQRTGAWTDDEQKLFHQRLAAVGANGQWGIFSMTIPGRVGYQCSNYYRQLIETRQIIDPNYLLDEKGKAHYLFASKKKNDDGSSVKTIRKHTKKKKKGERSDDESDDDAEITTATTTTTATTATATATAAAASSSSGGSMTADSSAPSTVPSVVPSAPPAAPPAASAESAASAAANTSSNEADIPSAPIDDSYELVDIVEPEPKRRRTTRKKDTAAAAAAAEASETVTTTKRKTRARRKVRVSSDDDDDFGIDSDDDDYYGARTTTTRRTTARTRGIATSASISSIISDITPVAETPVPTVVSQLSTTTAAAPSASEAAQSSAAEEQYDDNAGDGGDAYYDDDYDPENPLPDFIDPITLDNVERPAISPYGHVMGYDSWVRCLTSLDASGRRNICPLTKKPLSKRDLVILTHDNIDQYRDKIHGLNK